jgi:hypothetical protein
VCVFNFMPIYVKFKSQLGCFITVIQFSINSLPHKNCVLNYSKTVSASAQEPRDLKYKYIREELELFPKLQRRILWTGSLVSI